MYLVPLTGLPTVQGLDNVNQAGKPKEDNEQSSFASIMKDAMATLEQTQKQSKEDAYNLAMGDVASLHSMMINSAMETTAVETVVQLTSRAVSAYKEIMQMQI